MVREYVGGGVPGELAARADALDRRRREQNAEAWRAERELIEGLDETLAWLHEATDALAGAVLAANGYRRHNRGEWRKRRVKDRDEATVGAGQTPKQDPAEELSLQEGLARFAEIATRVEAGEESALPDLRHALANAPGFAGELIALAGTVEKRLIAATAVNDPLMRELFAVAARDLREELGGTHPTPLERLLAERIAACWLQLQHAEALHARGSKDSDPKRGDYHQRRLDRAHRRYLSAIRTLAQVRRLLKPGTPQVAQINIAERQINTASVSSGSGPLPTAGGRPDAE